MLARQPVVLCGALAGVALSGLSALTLGAPGSALDRLDALQKQLMAIRGPGTAAQGPDTHTGQVGKPLFGQPVDVSLRLDGVSILPGRKAALLSINGQPADWIELGDSRQGVTLVDVRGARATVDTDGGSKEVSLGEGGPPTGGSAPAQGAPSPLAQAPGRPQPAPYPVPAPVGPVSAMPNAGSGPSKPTGPPVYPIPSGR